MYYASMSTCSVKDAITPKIMTTNKNIKASATLSLSAHYDGYFLFNSTWFF